MATKFAEALAGNATSLYNMLVPPLHLDRRSRSQTDLSRAAVSCGDSPPFRSLKESPTPEFMINKALDVLRRTSPHFGER